MFRKGTAKPFASSIAGGIASIFSSRVLWAEQPQSTQSHELQQQVEFREDFIKSVDLSQLTDTRNTVLANLWQRQSQLIQEFKNQIDRKTVYNPTGITRGISNSGFINACSINYVLHSLDPTKQAELQQLASRGICIAMAGSGKTSDANFMHAGMEKIDIPELSNHGVHCYKRDEQLIIGFDGVGTANSWVGGLVGNSPMIEEQALFADTTLRTLTQMGIIDANKPFNMVCYSRGVIAGRTLAEALQDDYQIGRFIACDGVSGVHNYLHSDDNVPPNIAEFVDLGAANILKYTANTAGFNKNDFRASENTHHIKQTVSGGHRDTYQPFLKEHFDAALEGAQENGPKIESLLSAIDNYNTAIRAEEAKTIRAREALVDYTGDDNGALNMFIHELWLNLTANNKRAQLYTQDFLETCKIEMQQLSTALGQNTENAVNIDSTDHEIQILAQIPDAHERAQQFDLYINKQARQPLTAASYLESLQAFLPKLKASGLKIEEQAEIIKDLYNHFEAIRSVHELHVLASLHERPITTADAMLKHAHDSYVHSILALALDKPSFTAEQLDKDIASCAITPNSATDYLNILEIFVAQLKRSSLPAEKKQEIVNDLSVYLEKAIHNDSSHVLVTGWPQSSTKPIVNLNKLEALKDAKMILDSIVIPETTRDKPKGPRL
jgi:hypothetical protein